MQGAHRIGNREIYRRKYGSWVIDSPANIIIVDNLKCNASVDVGSSYGNHLEVIADILIYEYKKMWGSAGLGKLAPGDIAEILQSGDRRLAGPTLEAGGLCMTGVWYEKGSV